MKASLNRVSVFLLAGLLAGCLPSSCSRVESRALFPADSLSRSIAESLPVDTLRVVFDTAHGDVAFRHPRNVLFGQPDVLFVADVETNEIVTLNAEGAELARVALDDIVAPESIPYLIGADVDTLRVFFAGVNKMGKVSAETLISSFALAARDAAKQLRYAASDEGNWWLKTVDPDSGARLVTYSEQGIRDHETMLSGPYWSHAGPLRAQDDTLVSVRGYQPDVVRMTTDGSLDSLRLLGFDSPMLARMRSFRLGEAKNPPLLIPSLALTETRIFALNVRPGWLRVDVFDRSGTLVSRLVEPDPGFDKSFFPTDIAVRRQDPGTYFLAVSITDPKPSVRVYAWQSD